MAEGKAHRQPRRWHKLDNNANLFPVITSRKFSNVYRLSLMLEEEIVPELLQRALETVLPWFAAFRVQLRHGLFWHYLEANPGMPTVQKEDDYPVRYIDPKQNNQFLFKVTYFENRVNLEVFHVISDGTGGFEFLKAMVCQYLMLAHPSAFTEEQKQHHWFAGHAADTEDSYVANYVPTRKASYQEGRAYRLKGERNLFDSLSVVHAHIALPGLLELCHEKQVSISQYLVACIGWAVYTQQLKSRPPRHPVNIFIPVNLRNLFESTTTLNFFSNIYISLDYKGGEPFGFDDLLAEVKKQFEEKVTRQSMLERISYTVGSGNNLFLRMVPLPIKNAALRAVYEMSAKSSTLGFSNLGRITMPEPFAPFVTSAAIMLSTAPREPMKCTAGSYGKDLVFTVTSMLRSVSLQRAIIRRFAQDGLDVTIESNGVDYESL